MDAEGDDEEEMVQDAHTAYQRTLSEWDPRHDEMHVKLEADSIRSDLRSTLAEVSGLASVGANTRDVLVQDCPSNPVEKAHSSASRGNEEPPVRKRRAVQKTNERECELEERVAATGCELEAVYKGIKVKREKIEEGFAREAQLESTVMEMSESILQLTLTLTECKETLECCVCMERPVRFVALPCGHHFCGHGSCPSSQMSACPTCRGQITGTTELFGACSWLADMFETIEAVTCNGTGGDGIAMRTRADGRQELAADDVQRLEPAISAAEKAVLRVEEVMAAAAASASITEAWSRRGMVLQDKDSPTHVAVTLKQGVCMASSRTRGHTRSGVPRRHGPEVRERQLRQQAAMYELQAEAVYAGIQVKREVMDESFAQQARLESAVSALSDTILQHKSRLSEFKEALECCICFERTIRFVAIPCGHCFCFHSDCYSSELAECPTCRQQIKDRQQLFGACTWLADVLEDAGAAQQDPQKQVARSPKVYHAERKQMLSKIEGIITTTDEILLVVEEATRKKALDLEEAEAGADADDYSSREEEEQVAGTRAKEKELACPADESDLEEGEIRDTEEAVAQPLASNFRLCESGGIRVDKPYADKPLELEKNQPASEDVEEVCVVDEITASHIKGGSNLCNERPKAIRKRLCSVWVLGSCDDVRCKFSHGYQAEMCPKLYSETFNRLPNEMSQTSCNRGQLCPYAHSSSELQEMQDSLVMCRAIDHVEIVPKLCGAELANRCMLGSACPFAHSTRELVASLGGSAISRRVSRDVYLQPDGRPLQPRRSVLCQYWKQARCEHSDSKCDFAHGVDKSNICCFGHKCPRKETCAFFHPFDPLTQLVVAFGAKRPVTCFPRTVFVTGLLKTAEVADVTSIMAPFGEVESIRIIPSKGCALVTFTDMMSGVQAINILSQVVLIPGADQPLNVQWSNRQNDRSITRQHLLTEEFTNEDGMEEGEIDKIKQFETKRAATSQVVKRRYCAYCFETRGKMWHNHTVEMCHNKERDDLRRRQNEMISRPQLLTEEFAKDDGLEEGEIDERKQSETKEEATTHCEMNIDRNDIAKIQNAFKSDRKGKVSSSCVKIPPDVFARSFALNQKILKSNSLHELQLISRHHISDFTIYNVATACRRATKLFMFNRKQHDAEQTERVLDLISQLISRLQEVIHSLNLSRIWSTVWWCFGTLSPILGSKFQQLISTDTLNVLETKTIEVFLNDQDRLEGQSVASFLWGKVTMGRLSFISDFQEKSLQEKILNHIQSFNAIDLAQTIWALSKINCNTNKDLFVGLKSRFETFLPSCGPIDVANSVHGLHKLGVKVFGPYKLGVHMQGLVPSILSRIKQIGAGFRLTEICGVIVPLTKLEKERHLSESASSALFDMMDMFVETLLASGEVLRSGPQEITSLLDSLRRTSYRPNPAFVFTLNRRACEIKSQFTLQGVNVMLKVLADTSEYGDRSILRDLRQLLQRTLPLGSTQELSETMYSIAKIAKNQPVEFNPAEILSVVVAHIREKMQDFGLLDFLAVGKGIMTIGGVSHDDECTYWSGHINMTGEIGGFEILGWNFFLEHFQNHLYSHMRATNGMGDVESAVLMRVISYAATEIPFDIEEKLVLLAKDQVSRFDSHDVNVCLWSLARMKRQLSCFPTDLIRMIVRRCVDIIQSLKPHSICVCVWALGELLFKESSEFLSLAEDRLATIMAERHNDLYAKHMHMLLLGFFNLNHKPSYPFLQNVFDLIRYSASEDWKKSVLRSSRSRGWFKKILKAFGFDSSHPLVDLIEQIEQQQQDHRSTDEGRATQVVDTFPCKDKRKDPMQGMPLGAFAFAKMPPLPPLTVTGAFAEMPPPPQLIGAFAEMPPLPHHAGSVREVTPPSHLISGRSDGAGCRERDMERSLQGKKSSFKTQDHDRNCDRLGGHRERSRDRSSNSSCDRGKHECREELSSDRYSKDRNYSRDKDREWERERERERGDDNKNQNHGNPGKRKRHEDGGSAQVLPAEHGCGVAKKTQQSDIAVRLPVSATSSRLASCSAGKAVAAPTSRSGGEGADAKRHKKVIDPPRWAVVCDQLWALQKVTGKGPETIWILGRSFMTLGRSSNATEQLQSCTCSAMHAIIAFRRGSDDDGGFDEELKGRVCLQDLGSTHGTYVDGVKVTSGSWTVLEEGSVVTLGDKDALQKSDFARYKLCWERRQTGHLDGDGQM